jgi:hypothetical protein
LTFISLRPLATSILNFSLRLFIKVAKAVPFSAFSAVN